MSATVSAVIVSYNQRPYIRDAVESVLDQTFRGWELIIVDDGSTDGSVETIEALAARHRGRIEFLRHPGGRNLGIARTYALGIGRARAPYTAFLEADDRWERGYLEAKASLLERHADAGVAFSRYKVIARGLFGRDMAVRQRLLGLSVRGGAPFDNLRNLMKKNNIATFSAFVVRRPLLDEICLDAPPGTLYFDWWILFQLALRTKFVLDRSTFVHWRQSPESTLGAQKAAQHRALLCRFMETMYDEIGRQDARVGGRNRAAFLRNRAALPAFLSFYREPDARRFLGFFRASPLWALDALASCCINSWKYAR